jgi:hypothetical protein
MTLEELPPILSIVDGTVARSEACCACVSRRSQAATDCARQQAGCFEHEGISQGSNIAGGVVEPQRFTGALPLVGRLQAVTYPAALRFPQLSLALMRTLLSPSDAFGYEHRIVRGLVGIVFV